jgi:hypothetical protein
MSELIIFSKEDLERITKPRLLKLAHYYELEMKTSLNKEQMIDTFIKYFEEQKTKEEEVPTMSVRLRRIREQGIGSV